MPEAVKLEGDRLRIAGLSARGAADRRALARLVERLGPVGAEGILEALGSEGPTIVVERDDEPGPSVGWLGRECFAWARCDPQGAELKLAPAGRVGALVADALGIAQHPEAEDEGEALVLGVDELRAWIAETGARRRRLSVRPGGVGDGRNVELFQLPDGMWYLLHRSEIGGSAVTLLPVSPRVIWRLLHVAIAAGLPAG